MLVSEAEDSNVKIIDFGHMVKLEPGEYEYLSGELQGTEGRLSALLVIAFYV